MTGQDEVKPDFPADAFAGTANYYVRYRPPYPAQLLDDLARRAGITGDAKLLDLACGPGRVGLALAARFSQVWAIDLEPEMIEVGRREAARLGAGNINWIVGRAEDLAAPAGAFDLVTIGEAFHRLEQQRVAEKALGWLKPGGHLASLGCFGILSGAEPWQRIVAASVQRWTRRAASGEARSAGPKPGSGPEHYERVLREAGFDAVASHAFVERHVWTADEITGNLYSLSISSRKVLGADAPAFEAELRAALLAHDASGRYPEDMRFGYTIGRKPV